MPCAFDVHRRVPVKGPVKGCQFDVHDDDLVAFDGQSWCENHLPVQNSDGDKSEKALWDDQKCSDFNSNIIFLIRQVRQEADTLDLTGVIFPGAIQFSHPSTHPFHIVSVDFQYARFCASAVFVGVAFNSANFAHSIFEGDCRFDNSTVSYRSNFSKAHFFGGAYFHNTELGLGLFSGAVFKHSASFRNATAALFDFSACEFVGSANFENDAKAEFPGSNFNRAIFRKGASFKNRRFRSSVRFEATTFFKAPSFHNCNLHQDTSFGRADFLDTTSYEAARAYRTLKLAMEGHRAREEQAMFYALEQQSLRKQSGTPWPSKAASVAYEILSDYGRNFHRPLWVLAGLTVLIAGAYYRFLPLADASISRIEASSFAIQQIVRPFAVWGPAFQSKVGSGIQTALESAPFLLPAMASLQSILSIGLIALFVLALRRRFKMD